MTIVKKGDPEFKALTDIFVADELAIGERIARTIYDHVIAENNSLWIVNRNCHGWGFELWLMSDANSLVCFAIDNADATLGVHETHILTSKQCDELSRIIEMVLL